MKVPSVRFYIEDDYEDLKKLFDEAGHEVPGPGGLVGASLVAHDDKTGELVGFAWALAANGVNIAYMDHVVIKSALRKSSAGMILVMALVKFLKDSGVEEVIVFARPENTAMKRMLERGGARDDGTFHRLSISLSDGGE